MKIAVLSCIHSNLLALEAVAKNIESRKVDKVYCLGDVIDYGAEPRECLAFVRDRKWPTLMGNHEAAIALKPEMTDQFNPTAKLCLLYSRGALGKSERAWMAALPLTLEEDGFQLVHASPVKDKMYLQYLLSEKDVTEAFAAATRPLVFCGHTHCPMGLYEGSGLNVSKDTVQKIDSKTKTIINVGSTGQPRDRDPRACWVLYDSDKSEVEFCRVPYDWDEACKRIKDAGLPEKVAERLKTGT